MIAFFKRLNALFISFVLIGVYGIGVGLARLVYMFSTSNHKEKNDSYWIYEPKQKAAGDERSAY